jgi:predicted metal-binding protein
VITVTLCHTCPLGKGGFPAELSAALAAEGLGAVATVDCMSGCTRPSTLAVRAAGKTAYLFGDVTADDLPHVLTFLRLYRDAPDGNLADARPLGPLRMKAIARIPGEGVAQGT